MILVLETRDSFSDQRIANMKYGKYIPLIKSASNDFASFEAALASIGRAIIQNLSPTLNKYELGFQVIESNKENTSAVGIFGYRLGNDLVYVPMFYKNGKVKGLNQIRHPKRKLVVPLDDHWVEKILSWQKSTGGRIVGKELIASSQQPSLWQLRLPPSKYASDEQKINSVEWKTLMVDAIPDLADSVKSLPELGSQLDLVKLANDNWDLKVTIDMLCDEFDWYKEAFDKFYGEGASDNVKNIKLSVEASKFIKKGPKGFRFTSRIRSLRGYRPTSQINRGRTPTIMRASHMRLKPVKISYDKTKSEKLFNDVLVFRAKDLMPHLSDKEVPAFTNLNEDEKQKLRSGGNVYRDNRYLSDISVAHPWLVAFSSESISFSNPTESGLYQVLDSSGNMVDCLVFTKPYDHLGRVHGDLAVVIPVEEKSKAYVTPIDTLWAFTTKDRMEFEKLISDFKQVGDRLPKVPDRKNIIFIRPGFESGVTESTLPLEVVGSLEDGQTHAVRCHCYIDVKRRFSPSWSLPRNRIPSTAAVGYQTNPLYVDFGEKWSLSPYSSYPRYPHEPDRGYIHIGKHNGKFQQNGVNMYLPKGTRYLIVNEYGDGDHANEDFRFVVYNPQRFLLESFKKQSNYLLPLRITGGGGGYYIESDLYNPSGKKWFPNVNDLEEELIIRHGLSVSDGQKIAQLVKESSHNLPYLTYIEYKERYLPDFIKLSRRDDKDEEDEDIDTDQDLPPPEDRVGQGLSKRRPTSPLIDMELPTGQAFFADDVVPSVTEAHMGVTLPDFMNRGAETVERFRAYPTQHGILVPIDGVGNSGPQFPRKEDIEKIHQALQMGSKELFDASTVSSVVSHAGLKRLISESYPHLLKSLKSLGDLLAHMAWNDEEWIERFGESDVGPIEDHTESVFNNLGKLVLKLQEKLPDDVGEIRLVSEKE